MRVVSNIQAKVDLIHTTSETAEVAKYATKFSMRALFEPPPEERRPNPGWSATLDRVEPDFLATDLKRLVYLEAMVSGRSINGVLDQIRRDLEDLHAPVDVPLSDQPGIGDLHPEGHDD